MGLSARISKRLWSLHKPHVVYFLGRRGKSLASSVFASAMRNSGKNMVSLHGVSDLTRAAVTLGGKSMVRAWWDVYVKKTAYPELLAIELSADANHLPAAELWPLASQTTVVLCSFLEVTEPRREDVEAYAKKELALFTSDPKKVHLIYDADVPFLAEIVTDLGFERQSTISFDRVSDIQAISVDVLSGDMAHLDTRWAGVHAKVRIGGATLPFLAYGGIGRTYARAAMYAVAVAQQHGVNPIDSLQALRSMTPLPGRMALIPGVKKTMLVDDTYDTDLLSLRHALADVAALPLDKTKKRLAVLGDITAAGSSSEADHAAIGEAMADMPYQMIVAVGEKSADIIRGALRAGLPETMLFHFGDAEEAGKFVQKVIKQGDLVLIKGSAEAKLESIVKELMAFPLKAKTDLLQR